MKHKLARAIAALMLVTGLAIAPTPITPAAQASLTCGGTSGYLGLYMNSLDTQPCLVFRASDWPASGSKSINLNAGFYNPPGVRAGNCWINVNPESFSDCVSALKLSAPCTYGYSLYDNTDGTGLLYSGWGSHVVSYMPPGYNDNASLVVLRRRTTCPASADEVPLTE